MPHILLTEVCCSGKDTQFDFTKSQKEFIADKCLKMQYVKFGYCEKATKIEKIFHLKFDATQ